MIRKTNPGVRPVIMGLDLSLTGSGACIVPAGWTLGDWRQLKTLKVGLKLEQNASPAVAVSRLEVIVEHLVKFALDHDVTHGFVEGYAYGATFSRPHALGELGGITKYEMWRRVRLPLQSVPAPQARKFLCGTVPQRKTSGIKPKTFVAQFLYGLGARFASEDEGDAFVVANYGLSEVGLPAFCTEAGPYSGRRKP